MSHILRGGLLHDSPSSPLRFRLVPSLSLDGKPFTYSDFDEGSNPRGRKIPVQRDTSQFVWFPTKEEGFEGPSLQNRVHSRVLWSTVVVQITCG